MALQTHQTQNNLSTYFELNICAPPSEKLSGFDVHLLFNAAGGRLLHLSVLLLTVFELKSLKLY